MNKMNTAFVLTAPDTLEKRSLPMPVPKAGEILVKLEAVGVCGSDIHYYRHGAIGDFVVEYPFILGHECAGTVVELGPGVDKIQIGDRVALEPGVPCGKCEMCRTGRYNLCPDVKFLATPPYDGCLMEYIAFPADWAYVLPENMTAEMGALVEPMAIGMNAVFTGNVKVGDSVVILGAGCIGLVTLLAAKAAGAAKVIVVDLIDLRLNKALELGAEEIIHSGREDVVSTVMRITEGRGADVVIDCAGFSSTLKAAIQIARPAASIVVVGMGADKIDGLPLSPISTRELHITSIFRYRNLYPRTIAAIASGRIDVRGIVTGRFSFEETPEAFSSAADHPQATVKNMIIY